MNALTLISNQNAQALALQQSAMDTTKPVVDGYRPEASDAALNVPGPKQIAGGALYHSLFVGVFLFGGVCLLGWLTGELELKAVAK